MQLENKERKYTLSFATAKILFQALFPAMSYHLLLNIVNNAYRARLAVLPSWVLTACLDC